MSLKKHKQNSSVSVHFIADKKMTTLNKLYRDKNTTTDVLSFSTGDPGDLGDLFVSVPQIKRQAKLWGVSFQEEMTRMIVHGVLHLMNYTHETTKKSNDMFELQEKYIKQLL